MDRKFDFITAALFDRSYQKLPPIKDPSMVKPVDTFCKNLDRTAALICLPAWLIDIAVSWVKADQSVRLAMFTGVHPMEALGKKLEKPDDVRVHNAIVQVIQSTQNAQTPEMEKRNWDAAFRKFEEYVIYSRAAAEPTSAAYNGADAMLYSLLTQAWSAYEYLASDMWVSVLNIHHAKFEPNIRAARKKIQWNNLGNCGHDPKTEMGLCLKNDFYHELGLNGLGKIGPTYSATFGSAWVPLNGKPYYKDLFALERIRNLIVHSAGIVDKVFLDQIQKEGVAIFGAPKPGDPILPDGALCQNLISSAVVAGLDLITFVASQL